jgi:hypothetical protein
MEHKNRVIVRQGARKLTPEEVSKVSGGESGSIYHDTDVQSGHEACGWRCWRMNKNRGWRPFPLSAR